MNGSTTRNMMLLSGIGLVCMGALYLVTGDAPVPASIAVVVSGLVTAGYQRVG